MFKRLGEINSESEEDMFVYVTGKKEKTSGSASMVRARRRFRFAYVGKRLFYYCMSMGNNNLICFHSHALFWSVWNGCQTAAFRNNFLSSANLDFSFSQRAVNKADGCCVAQGNTSNTGCLSWLVSEASATLVSFYMHTQLIPRH